MSMEYNVVEIIIVQIVGTLFATEIAEEAAEVVNAKFEKEDVFAIATVKTQSCKEELKKIDEHILQFS